MKFPAFESINLRNNPEDPVLRELDIFQIYPNLDQPRKNFNEVSLEELASSIKNQGIIQPIIVRKTNNENVFQIVAGERRWKAAKMAGLTKIPAIIRDYDDLNNRIVALIENIQREKLNPIDKALTFSELVTSFSMTHDDVADAVGIPRATISNLIRLLNLNEEVQAYLKRGSLDVGHAKILLTLEPVRQSYFARMVIKNNLSVRKLEELISKEKNIVKNKINVEMKNYLDELTKKLKRKLSCEISIKLNADGAGRVIISVESVTDLNAFVELIENLEFAEI
jgi:ParB family chromosome partitioning protein